MFKEGFFAQFVQQSSTCSLEKKCEKENNKSALHHAEMLFGLLQYITRAVTLSEPQQTESVKAGGQFDHAIIFGNSSSHSFHLFYNLFIRQIKSIIFCRLYIFIFIRGRSQTTFIRKKISMLYEGLVIKQPCFYSVLGSQDRSMQNSWTIGPDLYQSTKKSYGGY